MFGTFHLSFDMFGVVARRISTDAVMSSFPNSIIQDLHRIETVYEQMGEWIGDGAI